jgi:hypothetical protein
VDWIGLDLWPEISTFYYHRVPFGNQYTTLSFYLIFMLQFLALLLFCMMNFDEFHR